LRIAAAQSPGGLGLPGVQGRRRAGGEHLRREVLGRGVERLGLMTSRREGRGQLVDVQFQGAVLRGAP